MAISSYAELQTAVGANWLHRTDLTDRVKEFIALAESEVYSLLDILEMEARITSTMSTTSRYLDLPDRFIKVKRLYLDTSPASKIFFVDQSLMPRYILGTSGKPSYYSIIGSEFEFDRISDTAYDLEMSILQRPQPLSDANSTNSVLTRFPDIFLYGALLAAEPYLQNDKRIGIWRSAFLNAVQNANTVAERSRYGDGLTVRTTVSEAGDTNGTRNFNW